jgi:hypothetical protein
MFLVVSVAVSSKRSLARQNGSSTAHLTPVFESHQVDSGDGAGEEDDLHHRVVQRSKVPE